MENQVGATPNTVMRIASISKSMTIAALGRLMDEGSVELDKSVFEYVPEWPKVTLNYISLVVRAQKNVRLKYNYFLSGLGEGKNNDAAVGQPHVGNPPLH